MLKFFLGIFIRACEFKRIYILVTKLTTFLYLYFKICVNYFSRVMLIILKALINLVIVILKCLFGQILVTLEKKGVEIGHVVCSVLTKNN